MYRCTECNTEYEVKPEFCECGNDVFIEIDGDAAALQEVDYQPAAPSSIFEQNSMEPQVEYQPEIEEERFSFDASIVRKKKITISLMAVSIIVAILLFSLVGNGTPKPKADPAKQAAEQARLAKLAETIPDVNAFWDDTPAYGKSSTKNSLPLLNNKLGELSPQMKRYMVSVGNDFSKNWSKNLISGEGLCKIEFTINKDGTINKSKIVEKSENESLNDSVSMVLTRVTNVDAPPEDYHGERIHLVFQVKDNGNFKIYYP